MAVFFHLSNDKNAEAIVASNDDRAKQSKTFFSPRTPQSRGGESPDPRICVAPRVWQCLISRPDRGVPQYIYRLCCTSAQWISKEDVKDAGATDEHWITDDVIKNNGGEIILTYEGVLNDTACLGELIRKWRENLFGNAVDPASLDERECVWMIDKATMEWKLRAELIPESTDEKPLNPFPVVIRSPPAIKSQKVTNKMDFLNQWERMKQSVRAEANRLVAEFPDFPEITATSLRSADAFCDLDPPTDMNSFFQASQAQAAVTVNFRQTRDSLMISRARQ